MAADHQNRTAHALVLQDIESGPGVPFMAMGLLGTVLGILLLAIGLWRAKVTPRWVALALAAFLLVAFAGSAVSDRAEQLSLLLYLSALAALAATIWRSSTEDWRSGVDATSPSHSADRRHHSSVS
jgi:hypothetical protein